MKKYEFSRAAIHFSWMVPATILMPYLQVDRTQLGMLLLVSFSLIFILDLTRILLGSYAKYTDGFFPYVLKAIFNELYQRTPLRKRERTEFTAMIWFCSGLSIIYLFLPIEQAYMCFVILASGDPAARILGQFAGGKKLYKKKTVIGSIGFVLASFSMLAIANVISHFTGYYKSTEYVIFVQLIACVASAFAELISGKYDNFFIPISAGIVMLLLL